MLKPKRHLKSKSLGSCGSFTFYESKKVDNFERKYIWTGVEFVSETKLRDLVDKGFEYFMNKRGWFVKGL